MNVDTSEFRALTDQADGYRRREALLTRTLAAEVSGGDGPLSRDRVVRRLADAVVEQGRLIAGLRASAGIPARDARGRHLRLIEGGVS